MLMMIVVTCGVLAQAGAGPLVETELDKNRWAATKKVGTGVFCNKAMVPD